MDTEKLKSVGINYAPELAGGLAGVLATLPGRKRSVLSRLLTGLLVGGGVYGGGKLLQNYLDNRGTGLDDATLIEKAKRGTEDAAKKLQDGFKNHYGTSIGAAIGSIGAAGLAGSLGYKYRKPIASSLLNPATTAKRAKGAAMSGLDYVKNHKLKSGLAAAGGLAAGAGIGYGLNKLRNAKYKE